jgi:hypothetical protein
VDPARVFFSDGPGMTHTRLPKQFRNAWSWRARVRRSRLPRADLGKILAVFSGVMEFMTSDRYLGGYANSELADLQRRIDTAFEKHGHPKVAATVTYAEIRPDPTE